MDVQEKMRIGFSRSLHPMVSFFWHGNCDTEAVSSGICVIGKGGLTPKIAPEKMKR